MHAIEGSGNVPAFLTKLWRLVDDVKTNDLISWTQNGRSFIIQNQAKFARELLPQYYKHNNMASFVRQLNMYGFHKVVSADSGGLRVERDEMEFAHQHFLRGQESLIENIKRKQQRRLASDGVDFSQIPTSRTVIIEENKSVSKLLNDVRDMKRDQDSMSTKLLTLKRENEALWREYANMRQKFSKQQQIIEKLIHFLLAMVKSPSKPLIQKRKFSHLALEGSEESSSPSAKINTLPQFSQGNPIDIGECEGGTVGGAQIQEVTDLVDPNDPESITNVFLSDDDSSEDNTLLPEVESDSGMRVSEFIKDKLETETVLTVNGEPFHFIDINHDQPLTTTTITDPVSTMTVVSPEGTDMTQNFNEKTSNSLLDEAPLSPELLDTVDPSAVTQSFKYAVSDTPVVSSSSSSVRACKDPSPSTSVSSAKVQTVSQKGKMKAIKAEKGTTSSSTLSVAVPDKGLHKQELQAHMDDMQTTIDSLQDLLSTGNFSVDPSMFLTLPLQMFGSEDYMPELDSMSSVTSGNELSVYNPSLLDLAGDIEEDDPMAFLNSASPTSTAAPTSTSSPSNSSAGPTPPKQLRLNIKRECINDDPLETPKILSPVNSPVYRGKRRTN
ncbi:heat shock factor protein isoform X3 [Procambarus clarkii]|uniref:heat shock factor protein isoform X3 n=1 Tax=Procambarus clarkii TaxID=6728 RepID=UPI001E674BA9|nr:heat shock factor protein-like isoform X3 [Procambarus clarkii]